MRTLSLLMVLALGGCIALSDNPPPRQTTVVVPQPAPAAVVCSNGASPPC